MEFKHIKNQGDEIPEVFVMGEIGRDVDGAAIANELRFLVDMREPEEIHIRINSVGGSMVEGFGIISAIEHAKTKEVKIVTINDGVAASMGGLIFMSGDERRMMDFSLLMMHNPNLGGQKIKPEQKDMMNQFRDSAITIIKNKSGLSKKDISKMLDNETWLGAEEAKSLGLNDFIISTRHTKKRKQALNLSQIGASALDVMNSELIFPVNGDSLAATLNRIINNTEDREVTIRSMASGASLSVSTVKQILAATIDCPPIRRLESFAETLSVSLSRLTTAGNRDGCNYNPENKIKMKNVFAKLGLTDDATEESVIQAIENKYSGLEASNVTLKADLKTAHSTIAEKDTVIDSQKAIIDAGVKEGIETIVDEAIKVKKIKKESREQFITMGMNDADSLKSVLDAIPAPSVNLLKGIKGGFKEIPEMGLREMEKKDAKGLKKIREENPEMYAAMHLKEYGVSLNGQN